jgi:hypothetical protein
VRGTQLGLEGYNDRLGDFDAASFERQPVADGSWAGRFAELAKGELSPEQAVDVALVGAELAGRAVMEDWQAWRRDPSVYLEPCLGGVFSLWLHRLWPEAALAEATVARLRAVLRVLDSARSNLDPDMAPKLLVERGARSAGAGVAYFRDLLPAGVEDEGLRAAVGRAGAEAADALQDFASHLSALGGQARGDWAIGERRYSALLRQRELLSYGAEELHTRGVMAWSEIDSEMTDLARRIDEPATGWQSVVADLGRDHPGSPEEMRASYERSCAEARQFLVDHELVTLPVGERCLVEPSPVFQRPLLAVASYSQPPPFSTSRTGHFFVPYPPEGVTAEQLTERLADNGFHFIPTTSVHEAYPGHHWQLSWSADCPRRIRHAIRTPYFLEGWALYAEKMMREEGFFPDVRQELCHLQARIFRAARIVVDTALHTGDMTVDQAVAHMTRNTGLTEEVARAEVDRYCAWPTQAPAYLTGSLEIERMRDRWLGEGLGGLREFHDCVASSPGLPLTLAEQLVFGEGQRT